MKINIEGEILRIFWMTWGILMKFSEKTWHKIILKVTKMQVCNLSLENIFLEKPQGSQIDPPTSTQLF